MVKILSRLVDLNAREIKRLEKSVGEINKLEPKAKKLEWEFGTVERIYPGANVMFVCM